MTFISEKTIDEVADELSRSGGTYETGLEELQARQPLILAYLFSESASVFTRPEQEFMLYLTLVVYQAVTRVMGPRPEVTEIQLGTAEEANWSLLQPVAAHRFHERLDIFFQDTDQEDLLAFVEDALSDDSDEWSTREGREAMFVALKSIIDCLTAT